MLLASAAVEGSGSTDVDTTRIRCEPPADARLALGLKAELPHRTWSDSAA